MTDDFNDLIGKIYDCAIEPEGWTDTLTEIRDRFDFAYLSLHFMTFPASYPRTRQKHMIVTTDWDPHWLEEVQRLTPEIPDFDKILAADIDAPTSQLRHTPETDFHRTRFYREWVAPQRLSDSCHTNVLRRNNMTAQLVGTIHDTRAPLTDEDLRLMGLLSPHIRRALVISDLLDLTQAQVQVYRSLLDHLSVAVFLLEDDARVAYCNAAADALMATTNCLTLRQRRLQASSVPHGRKLDEAIARAAANDPIGLGLWGNGMVLPDRDGAAVVAYLLPLGASDRRRALGDGLAALVVTTADDARPPAVEVLTALSGLTVSEARIALSIAEGDTVEDIAARQGIAVATVRKHLANAFDKTDARSQASLGAFINRLRVPIKEA